MEGPVLRPVVDADVERFFEHQLDEAARRMAAFTSEDPNDRDAFDRHWTKIRNLESVVLRTIVVRDDIAGHVASFMRGEDREVTYWIDRAHWGSGIATAALRAFLEVDGTRPLFARVAHDNAGSMRVLQKCGFEIVRHERGFANARGEEIEEAVLQLG